MIGLSYRHVVRFNEYTQPPRPVFRVMSRGAESDTLLGELSLYWYNTFPLYKYWPDAPEYIYSS